MTEIWLSCITELRTLHENMEKQMTEKLAAIESARAELATATAEAQVCSLARFIEIGPDNLIHRSLCR